MCAFRPRRIAGGAACLGAHIEGPFISPQGRGVHDPSVLRDASLDEIQAWLENGPPAIVTLAPERPGGLEAIRRLVSAGVVVSLGHSAATSDQARGGLEAGARLGTPLFNAMPPLQHRAPGLVGALLADRAQSGHHCRRRPPSIRSSSTWSCAAGRRSVILVSDALAAAGAPAGESVLGDRVVVSDGRTVRRTDGTLAGSALLLDACLRTAREWLPDLALAEVVRMATQTPAEALGLRTKGRVAVGQDADLVVLDTNCQVRQTIVGGVTVASAPVEVRV